MTNRFPYGLLSALLKCFLWLAPIAPLAVFGGVACTRDLPDPGRFVIVAGGGMEQPGTEQPGTEQPQQPTPGQPTGSDTNQPGDRPVEIPDQNFRSWVMWNYDADKDGILSSAEALSVTRLEFDTKEIASLEGIERFPNLTYLSTSSSRRDGVNLGLLTELDLGSNPKLQHIHLIYNNIKTLKLGDHPDLDYLDLDYNEVSELDVKGFRELTLLQVSYNNLTRIDVGGLDELSEFDCDRNPVDTIVLANAKLESFRCAGTLVRTLDFTKCPKINNVDCTECPNLTVIKLAKGQVVGNIRKDDKAKIEYYE